MGEASKVGEAEAAEVVELEQALGQQIPQNLLEEVAFMELQRMSKAARSTYSLKPQEMAECRDNPWHPLNLVFTTDYDDTCTVKDTTEILVKLAISSSPEEEKRFCDFMSAHQSRVKECLKDFVSVSEKKNSGQYDAANLRVLLRALGALEKRSNKEIIESGVVTGIRREQIKAEATTIPLLDRCSEVLLQLAAINRPVHVISANWSRDNILGGLANLPKHLLFVHSNNLNYNSDGLSDGTFQGAVQDSFDKESTLQAIRSVYSTCTPQKKMVVYLGDSQNDLLALLDADLGIVMGRNETFRSVLSRHSIELLPLKLAAEHISTKSPTSFRQSGKLFQAAGWAEIEACLFNSKL